MNYKKEEISKTQVKISYEVSFEDWQRSLDEAYNKTKSQFNIAGFRKGKAPRKKIEAMYGVGVFFDDALDIILPEYYEKTFEFEKELQPVARPVIDIVAISDAELKFTALITLRPEVKLGKYKGLEIKKAEAKVTKTEIDEEIKRAQEGAGSWEPVTDRDAKDGDKTVIDYSGRVGDDVFEGGTAEKQELVLGSNMFIPGFEEQVVGMKIGETKDITVKFPDEYGAENLAGQDAIFTVTLHEIKTKVLPELDDDFAKDVSEFDTFKEYKDNVKKSLTETKQKQADIESENELIKSIVESAEVEIPEIMIEERAEDMVRDFEYRLMYQGLKAEDYYKYTGTTPDQMKAQYLENAKTGVRTQLVMGKIIDDEKLAEGVDEKDGAKVTEKLLDFLKTNNKFV